VTLYDCLLTYFNVDVTIFLLDSCHALQQALKAYKYAGYRDDAATALFYVEGMPTGTKSERNKREHMIRQSATTKSRLIHAWHSGRARQPYPAI